MNLTGKLANKDHDHWDFKGIKKNGIHSIANYPAVMVAPMQHEIIEAILKENPTYKKMLDPFHGSGVTLVEGQSLGLDVWGIDINPYAHIITLAKLENYDRDTIELANKCIMKKIEEMKQNKQVKSYFFDNIEKWFRDDIIKSLSLIRIAIMDEADIKTRRYYWLCFGEIVKKYSNTRSSTFKLHIKQSSDINKLENKVIDDFIEKIEETYLLIGSSGPNKFHLKCEDSINVMKTYPSNSFDLICTSPPYGDNATTVTYGQFSVLQLLWINHEDFDYNAASIENYSKIDSMSLGGNSSKNNAFFTPEIVTSYVSGLSSHKQNKVIRFYSDYENAFRQMSRLLSPNGSMILTLGNRMVDRIEFPFIEINKQIARYYELDLTQVLSRNILNKRMPSRVSRLSDGKPVNSMSKETVLIFRKREGTQ